VAVSFIHWVNQNSLRDRVLPARLGTAAVLVALAAYETLGMGRVSPG
jgi:hypothetical protein